MSAFKMGRVYSIAINTDAAMWIRFAVDIIGCMFEFNLNVFIPMKDDMWKRCGVFLACK